MAIRPGSLVPRALRGRTRSGRGHALLPCAAALVFAFMACTAERERPRAPRAQGLRWEVLPPSPTERTEVSATSDGARIFVAGGFDSSGDSVRTVEIYDIRTRTWRRGPDLPVALNHAMAATLDGTPHVLGGYFGPGLTRPSNRAFALQSGRWGEIVPMPEPRAEGGAAALAGKLYVAGGSGPSRLANNLLVFDPGSRRWSSVQGPPTHRQHLGVAAYAGRLYVVGGRTGGIGSNLAAAEAFDPATGEWTRLPDMPTPRGGIAAAATSNGFVVAVGGEADATFDEAEAFDVGGGRWTSLPPMPTARHGLGVAAIDTTVYVLAGGRTPGLSVSDANEAIDLSPLGR